MRRRIGTILLLAGSAALVWCLTVLGSAALYQWYESRRLSHVLPPARVVAHVPQPPQAAMRPPAPNFHEPKPYDVIGLLEIPRLNVSTVVLEGDDAHALRLGAGHVPGTALPEQSGNVAIAAHRDTFFRPLRHIAPNDRITLQTPDGAFQYVVESTEIVPPTDVAVLAPSHRAELTLVTCYPFYYIGSAPLRFIVHAKRAG